MGLYSSCPVMNTLLQLKNKILPAIKNDCISHDDIIRTLDFINYNVNSFNDLHKKELYMFSGSCNLIYNFYKTQYAYMSEYLFDKGILFGILGNEKESESVYRGFCGWEPQYKAYRLYINLTLVPYFPVNKTFTYIFDIAKHEMAHLFLHSFDPDKYALENCIHDELFVEIISEIDNYFYNKNEVLDTINRFSLIK